MKRILIILSGILSAALFLVLVLNAKNQDNLYLENLGKSESIAVITLPAIDEDSATERLESFCQQLDCSIIREDYIDEEGKQILFRSGIYAPNYWEQAGFNLRKGHLPQNETEFLATFETGDPNQCGLVRDLFSDMPAVFQTLRPDNPYLDQPGTYYLAGNSDNKEEFIEKLANWLNIPASDLTAASYRKEYAAGPIKLIGAGTAVLILLFGLMAAFYPFTQTRKTGLLRLQGWKEVSIWKELYTPVLGWCLLMIAAVTIFLITLTGEWDFTFVFRVILAESGLWLCLVLLSTASFLVLRKFTIESLLKGQSANRMAYYCAGGVKLAALSILVLLIPAVLQIGEGIFREIQAMQAWRNAAKELTVTGFQYTDNEFQQMLNGEDTIRQKLSRFFFELEKTADAGYVNCQSYGPEFFSMPYFSQYSRTELEEESEIFAVFVNANEMERYRDKLGLSLDMFDPRAGHEEITILLPDTYSVQKAELAKAAILYSWSVSNETPATDVLQWHPDGQPVFMPDTHLIDQGNGFVTDPVFVCLNDQALAKVGVFVNQAPNNPLRIEDTEANRKAIEAAMVNAGLGENQLKLESLYDAGFKPLMQTYFNSLLMACAAVLFLLFVSLAASCILLLVVMEFRKKELFVFRFLGYPLTGRYQKEFSESLLIWFLAFCLLIVRGINWKSFGVLLIFLSIDLLAWIVMVGKMERKSSVLMLKGAEL